MREIQEGRNLITHIGHSFENILDLSHGSHVYDWEETFMLYVVKLLSRKGIQETFSNDFIIFARWPKWSFNIANGTNQDVLYYSGIFLLRATKPRYSLAPAVNHEMINDETKDAACLTSETIHGCYSRTPGGRLLLTHGRQNVKWEQQASTTSPCVRGFWKNVSMDDVVKDSMVSILEICMH